MTLNETLREVDHINSYEAFDAMLDQQIQQHRKGDLELTVVDPFGQPVAGKEMSLKQTDHDFTFGVCPNGHLGMANTLANGEGSESEKYWELIGELFNATTLWWGWRVLEPKKGAWTFDQRVNDPTNHYWAEQGPMERMVQRAEALGHELTAHGILYPRKDVSPEWIQACDPKEATEFLERHVRRVARRYKDRVKVWHPVNEAYDEIQTVGNLKINEGAVYKWIEEEAPHGIIVNNGGYEIHPDFYKQGIDNAARFNAKVDACGIRGYHYLYRINDLESQKRRWNHFNDLVQRYGIGLKYTEIGVNSELHDVEANQFISGNAPHEGVVTIELKDGEFPPMNEEVQSLFTLQMYKLIFAHPAMTECTWWDLVDGYNWNHCPGGLVREDFSKKPAFDALKDLLHNQWKTRITLTTDHEGKIKWNGFFGTYAVNSKYLTFTKASTTNVLVEHSS